jgi:poly-gamma-glutamate synthesis protein (capsule biosynthesis protein)
MDRLCLAAVGDVFVERQDARSALAGIRPLLDAADVVFGNFEGVLTDKNVVIPGASSASVAATAHAAGLAGFDVMSLANNHAMDAGHGGLVDTAAALSEHGIQTVGAGANLAEALRPVVVEHRQLKLAVIAVTAVLQHGAEARRGAPGVAPLRADDCYQPPYPGVRCPGVPPRVISILDEGDWDAVAAAIESAKEAATLVAVSVHWGDHTRPWVLTDHERLCAELIADAGADLILGHHQHILRGMDFVSGVPVWFGLGHAAFDLPRLGDELANNGLDTTALSAGQLAVLFGEYGIYPRSAHPSFPFHPIARRTVVAVADLAADGVRRCGVVPCLIDGDGVAQPVRHGSADWRAFVEFLAECQARAGLSGRVIADTDWLLAGQPVIEFARAG